MGNVTQERLTRRRWAGVLFMALVAAVVVLFCQHWITDWMKPVADRLGSLPWLWRVGIVLSVSTAVWWYFNRRHLGRYTNLERMLRRPPLLVSVFAGTTLVLLFRHCWSGFPLIPTCPADWADLADSLEPLFWIFMGPAVGISALAFQDQYRPARVPPSPAASAQPAPSVEEFICGLKQDPHKLIAWFQDDDELQDVTLDAFGHRHVVDEIIKILSGNESGDTPVGSGPEEVKAGAIHLVGPVGSGKSTICKWVQQHFEHDDRMRVVRVTLWPYKDAESAVRGVLDRLLEELSNLTDTLSLAGVPEAYVSAVESEIGLLGRLARLAQVASDPQELLEQLSTILKSLGMHFVLIVEDYERFLQRESSTTDTKENTQRAPELDALFYLLDNRDHLTVIIASVDLEAGFDRQKIARRVFEVPKMAPWDVLDIVKHLRTHCLAGNPRPFINPGDDNAFDPVDPASFSDEWIGIYSKGNGQLPGVAEAFAQLCSTPRQLKAVLRDTWDAWDTVCGEIEWDSLTLITCLKVCRPDVFAHLNDQGRQNVLRADTETHGADGSNPALKGKVFGDVRQVVEGPSADSDAGSAVSSVWAILAYLYPDTFGNTETGFQRYSKHPQAVSATGLVNYFKVAVFRKTVSWLPSDQRILSVLYAWREDERASLGPSLFDSSFLKRVLHFKGKLTREHTARLLREAARNTGPHEPATYHDLRHGNAGMKLWVGLRGHWSDIDWARMQFESIIADVLAINAWFVYQLVCFETARTTAPSVIFDKRIGAHLQRCFLHEFAACARGDTGAVWLLEAIPLHHPWFLYEIDVNFLAAAEQKEAAVAFWSSVGPSLLDLTQANPHRGLRCLLPLVASVVNHGEQGVEAKGPTAVPAYFKRAQCEHYFPKNFDRLMRILAHHVTPPDVDEHMRKLSVEARKQARIELGLHLFDNPPQSH